jgi:hypothetical protein
MLRHGTAYAAKAMAEYEAAYQQRRVRHLQKQARELGYELMQRRVEEEVVASNA